MVGERLGNSDTLYPSSCSFAWVETTSEYISLNMSKNSDNIGDSELVSKKQLEEFGTSLLNSFEEKLSSLVSSLAHDNAKSGSSSTRTRDNAIPHTADPSGVKEEEDDFNEEESQPFVDPLAWADLIQPGYEILPSATLSPRPKYFPLRGDSVAETINRAKQKPALQEYKSLACFGLYHACATKALEANIHRIQQPEVREEFRAILRTFQELEEHWRRRLQYVRAIRSGSEDPALTKLFAEVFLDDNSVGGAPSVTRGWDALKKSYLQKRSEQSILQAAKSSAQATYSERRTGNNRKKNGFRRGKGKGKEDEDASVDAAQE